MESMAEGTVKDLVASGHALADDMTGAPSVLVRCLATQLEVQLVRANALAEDQQKAIESIKQADAAVKLAHEKFSALAAENELARKAVQAFCDVVGDNTEVIAEVVGRDGVLVILEAMKATGNMPATDAFLAEVRAQGVEMAMEHMQSSGSLTFGDCYISLNEFAAQLRKGGNQ